MGWLQFNDSFAYVAALVSFGFHFPLHKNDSLDLQIEQWKTDRRSAYGWSVLVADAASYVLLTPNAPHR